MTRRSLARRWTYKISQLLFYIVGVLFYRVRLFGVEHWPADGAGLVCSNHQSNLDPILIGMACKRRMNYLARASLFRSAFLGRILHWFDAIPIEREGIGIGGLRETLRRLKRGEMVLIFPEGTRSPDGSLQSLHPGFCAVARRAGAPIIPVAIDGAYAAWPRDRRWPRLTVIHIHIGRPIGTDEMVELDDQGLVAELSRRLAEMHASAVATRTAAM